MYPSFQIECHNPTIFLQSKNEQTMHLFMRLEKMFCSVANVCSMFFTGLPLRQCVTGHGTRNTVPPPPVILQIQPKWYFLQLALVKEGYEWPNLRYIWLYLGQKFNSWQNLGLNILSILWFHLTSAFVKIQLVPGAIEI